MAIDGSSRLTKVWTGKDDVIRQFQSSHQLTQVVFVPALVPSDDDQAPGPRQDTSLTTHGGPGPQQVGQTLFGVQSA